MRVGQIYNRRLCSLAVYVQYIGTTKAAEIIVSMSSLAFVEYKIELTKVQQCSEYVLRICEVGKNIPNGDSHSLSLVRPRSSHDKTPFFFSQPFRFSGEVRNEEEGSKADKYCHYAFEYEYPSPAAVALDAVHVGNRTGKKTAKHARC